MSVFVVNQHVANAFEMLHRKDHLPPRPVSFVTWRRAPSPWRITFAPRRRSSPCPRSAMEHCTVKPYLLRAGLVVLKADTPNAPRDPEWGRPERALPQLMAQRGAKRDPHSWPNSKEMAPRSWPFLARAIYVSAARSCGTYAISKEESRTKLMQSSGWAVTCLLTFVLRLCVGHVPGSSSSLHAGLELRCAFSSSRAQAGARVMHNHGPHFSLFSRTTPCRCGQ